MKLDYSLSTIEERLSLVNQILSSEPSPNLELLADYLIFCVDTKDKEILTRNRLTTINKRETSLEALSSSFASEDAVYDLMTLPDRNVIFKHKLRITPKDLEEIPALREIQAATNLLRELLKTAKGRDAYIYRQAAIDLYKEQYVIKDAYRKPVNSFSFGSPRYTPTLPHSITVSPTGEVTATGVTLLNPTVIKTLFAHYNDFRYAAQDQLNSELWSLFTDFEELRKALTFPWSFIAEKRIEGYCNKEVHDLLLAQGKDLSTQTISNIWSQRIPHYLAKLAEERYLDYYYLEEKKGYYKRCAGCGQIKLGIPRYFSLNPTSPDGLYSLCKECKNKRWKGKKLNGDLLHEV